ncbi:MAG: histone deacetylase [Bacteroidia bacterium]
MIKIAWSPLYCLPLPANHRFPMVKYELIPEQLLYEGTFAQENFFEPGMDEIWIAATHDAAYIRKVKTGALSRLEMRRIGFPYSHQMVQREINIMNGTTEAASYALEHGIAFNIAGGTHHASRDTGEGFCIFNDIAVAATFLIETQKAKQVLVADLDVHQGNGTAKIFEHEPRVFTFSMHGTNNFPLKKTESDLDIALSDGTGDEEYLTLLNENLQRLIRQLQPDFIFYQAGVDVIASDKLGRLNLSLEGCRERDRLVLEQARVHNIPLVAVMGGGYSTSIREIVEAHCNLYRLAANIYG